MNINDFEKWCDATNNLNTAVSELLTQREENAEWICNSLKKELQPLGDVEKVSITNDGSIIDATFCGKVIDIKNEILENIPIPCRVVFDRYNIHLRFYTGVIISED